MSGATVRCKFVSASKPAPGRAVQRVARSRKPSSPSRAARMLALAHYIDRQIDDGTILDYMPISQHAANLLFQALSERHERGSVIVNTNLPFGEWGQVFQTERLAVALLDRITHNSQVL